MTVLFAHDHKFRRINGDIFSLGGLSNEVLKRYTSIFGEIKVVARIYDEKESKDQYSKILDNSIEVFCFRKMSLSTFKNMLKEADIVIARLPSRIGNIAIKYAKKFKKPYLIEVVGCAFNALWNHSLLGKFIAPGSYYKMKKAIINAPYVLYVTKNFLQSRYPSKGKTIDCSDVFLSPVNDEVLLKRLEKIKNMKDTKSIVLGTIGPVNMRYKGQHYIIKAISKLKKRGFNIKYELVGSGDGKYLQELAQKYDVKENIVFKGSIPHSEIFKYLDNLDLYVQPSKTEGLPRALIEAMSRACPAIGSEAGGIKELLEDDFIVELNVDKICKKIESLNEIDFSNQATLNYNESKNYTFNKLEFKRNVFLSEIKRRCYE